MSSAAQLQPTPKSPAGTPEDVLVVDPTSRHGYHVDAIECAMVRADSLLTMLSTQFEDQDSQTLHRVVISNVLWAIQGEIEMAKKLFVHGYESARRGK